MNGGTGTIADQVCNPNGTTGSCSVTVSSTAPTRNGYRFLGWSDSNSATAASYTAGKTITLTTNKTIYAVWQRVININTSVDGGNGSITPSQNNVVQGTTRTIVFSPRTGYEIDNVKVNNVDKTSEVANNKLTITAGDEDLNVVVKYKAIPTPDPDPTPDPTVSQTYYMYFSSYTGETGTPNTLSCTATGTQTDTLSCTVTIPGPTNPEAVNPDNIPVREGYVFLGYSNQNDRNTIAYQPNDTVTLTDDIYAISAWAPIYTLSYDNNGGTSEEAVTPQTCHPTTINGSCDIVISNTRPTKEGKEFFGWASDEAAETPEYLPGDTYTFSGRIRTATLYAIYVDGGVEWIQGQDYTKDSGIDLIVEFDYPYQNFVSLTIDEATVDPANYTVSPGSTILTINSDYVNTLETGGHTMQANYRNGTNPQTTFAVEDNSGQGGDEEDEGDDDEDEGSDEGDEGEEDDSTKPDDDLPVPNTSAGTPDTGGNEENNTGSTSNQFIAIIGVIIGTAAWIGIYRHRGSSRKIDFDK